MSYSCGTHSWRHALSPCPVCTQMRTTTLTSNGAVIGHSQPFRVHEACESRIAELEAACGEMRAGLERCLGLSHVSAKIGKSGQDVEMDYYNTISKALASPHGARLNEELAALREIRDAARLVGLSPNAARLHAALYAYDARFGGKE